MADDVFGIPSGENPDQDWLNAGLEGTEEAPTPTEQPAPSAPQPQAPAGPTVEAPQAETEQPTEGEAQKRWANKYGSPEELEKGYRLQTDEVRRSRQRAREIESRYQEAAGRVQVLEQTLQRALPYLQGQVGQQRPPQGQPAPVQRGYEDYPDPYGLAPQQQQQQGPVDPNQLAAYIDQQLTQRTEAIRQDLAAQMAREEAVGYAEDAISGFFENHPEVEVRSEADDAMVNTINDLNEAWQSAGRYVDVTEVDHIERAFEASKREALREVLLNNPRYIETEAGMTLARFEASLLEGSQPMTQGAAQVPASMVGQRPPVVERASTGPSPGGNQPADEFEEAVMERRRAQAGTFGGSVF